MCGERVVVGSRPWFNFLHGGGYGIGSATAYRGVASQIAQRAQAATFVLDYPLAPEQPLPLLYIQVGCNELLITLPMGRLRRTGSSLTC
jgi:acetyl esterase/lipase